VRAADFFLSSQRFPRHYWKKSRPKARDLEICQKQASKFRFHLLLSFLDLFTIHIQLGSHVRPGTFFTYLVKIDNLAAEFERKNPAKALVDWIGTGYTHLTIHGIDVTTTDLVTIVKALTKELSSLIKGLVFEEKVYLTEKQWKQAAKSEEVNNHEVGFTAFTPSNLLLSSLFDNPDCLSKLLPC
jgi:hypothetical protein